MRTRAPALAAVLAFAVAVALVAGLAGRDGDRPLEKLPVGSLAGAGAADAAAPALAERSALAAPDFGGVEYRVEGDLPALPDEAPAYRLPATTTADRVARLAAALGVEGEVATDADGWVVRDDRRELRVQRAAGLPWFLGQVCAELPVTSDGPTAPDDVASCSVAASAGAGAGVVGRTAEACKAGSAEACAVATSVPGEAPVAVPAPSTTPCPPGAECAANLVAPAPAPAPVPIDAPLPPDRPVPLPEPLPVDPPARPEGLPSRADAERLARDAFTRLGLALDGFVMDDAWSSWEARVDLRVGGLTVVGLTPAVGIGPGGEVVHASGALAVPELIGDYPLAGLDAGLQRLREGFGPWPRPLAAVAEGDLVPPGAEPAVDLPAVDPAVCDDPTVLCGPTTPAAPVVQVVTGARLVLLHLDAVLVPAYVFELEDGGETFPVPAATDEWLDLGGTRAER